MGQQAGGQDELFYSFNLEAHVPAAHLLRGIDRFLDLSKLRRHLAKKNRYTCPAGNHLHTTGRPTADGTILYRSKNVECASCPLKPQCCPNTPQRKIPRSIHEASRDMARTLTNTEAYRQSRKDRKKVEMLFAHLKRILKLDRLRAAMPAIGLFRPVVRRASHGTTASTVLLFGDP
jgi:hypothetical protein